MSDTNSMYFGTTAVGLIFTALLVGVIYFLTVGSFPKLAPTDSGTERADVAERIRPVGQVRVAGDSEAAAPSTAEATATPSAPPSRERALGGEAIYAKACVACHAAGVAGAPKLGDKAAWKPRMAQGLEGLMTTVLNGKGAMPPRGTCTDCSDEELKAAVEYMLSKVE